jgi:hypothetical protein
VAGLTIPSEYEGGIAVIKSLSNSDIKRALKVLKGVSPSTDTTSVVAMLRPVLSGVSETDTQKFVDTLYSLYLFRSHSDVSVDEFVVDLSEATKESENPAVRTTDGSELASLKSKLKALLTVRPLSTLSKAHGLRYDFANVFWDAKVISDIRPVWEGGVKTPPEGIVMTQTLKLEYHHAGGHGEIYIYLDNSDIAQLISVLKRAQDKFAMLKSLSTAKWMKILDE